MGHGTPEAEEGKEYILVQETQSWAHMPVRVASLRDTTSGFKSRHCFVLWTAAGLEAMIQNDLSFCLIWSCDQTTGDTLSVISFAALR